MTRNLVFIITAVALWIGWDFFFVLQENEQAIVTQFGEPKKTHRSPGIRAKLPFADTVRRMEKRILGSDTPPAEYLTLDKKKLVADPLSRWRIINPLKFYKSVRDESGAKARLDDIVNSELRQQIASRDFGEIIGNKREDLVQKVATKARKQLEPFGIELVDIRIKRGDRSARRDLEGSVTRGRSGSDQLSVRPRSGWTCARSAGNGRLPRKLGSRAR
jgi:membrane protease subunit HflC